MIRVGFWFWRLVSLSLLCFAFQDLWNKFTVPLGTEITVMQGLGMLLIPALLWTPDGDELALDAIVRRAALWAIGGIIHVVMTS